jgi:hypothetical protein
VWVFLQNSNEISYSIWILRKLRILIFFSILGIFLEEFYHLKFLYFPLLQTGPKTWSQATLVICPLPSSLEKRICRGILSKPSLQITPALSRTLLLSCSALQNLPSGQIYAQAYVLTKPSPANDSEDQSWSYDSIRFPRSRFSFVGAWCA